MAQAVLAQAAAVGLARGYRFSVRGSADGSAGRRVAQHAPSSQFSTTPHVTSRSPPQQAERMHLRALADFSSASAPSGASDVQFVPRVCTLNEFSEQNNGSEMAVLKAPDAGENRTLLELLVASIEATAQVADFETLSGRLAMIGFATALATEYVTGNSVFTGLDIVALGKVLGLCLAAAATAGGSAVAWRAKQHVTDILGAGCKRMVDTAVDRVIEGLFFEENSIEVHQDRS